MAISGEPPILMESDTQFEVPAFAAECLDAARPLWSASFEHPFVKSLLDGSLGSSKFRFYQMQDARYLEAYADACSLISVRFQEPEHKMWFIEAARLALVVERELHTEYGRTLNYSPEDIQRLELTPNNRAYQNHLLVSCQKGTLLEAVAALAPCPWLYADIGTHVAKSLPGMPDDHPYLNWLQTYADPAFVTYTNELLVLMQALADRHPDPTHRARAVDAFCLSTNYEYMFWDQAWDRQTWPGNRKVAEMPFSMTGARYGAEEENE